VNPERYTRLCDLALERAATQYRGFQAAYQNPRQIPRSFRDGAVHTVPPSAWTSGFVAGNFWLLFEYTRENEGSSSRSMTTMPKFSARARAHSRRVTARTLARSAPGISALGLSRTQSPCVAHAGCDAGYPVVWCPVDNGAHVIPGFAAGSISSFFAQF
jgi:hypothetical protein